MTPAEALMTEYRRCCLTGGLVGGVLAYDADGPGDWFPAGASFGLGTFGLPVAWNSYLTRRAAEQLIRDATVSDDDIRRLLVEAGSVGDREMGLICDRALHGDGGARAECMRVIFYARRRAADDTEDGS